MQRTISYIFLVIASLILVAGFVTSKTYLQLAIASFFYPFVVYLIYKTLPAKQPEFRSIQMDRANASILQPAFQTSVNQPVTVTSKEGGGIEDFDKRGFLKLIGAAGLSFFIFSIFNKRPEVPFFNKLTGEKAPNPFLDSEGKPIELATKPLPTEGYQISEIDDSSNSFYGFINKEGNWFIMKEDAESGSFRYSKGETEFPVNWKNRAVLKYDYFHQVF